MSAYVQLGVIGALEVDPRTAEVVAVVQRRLASLRARAEAIGPPPIFAGATYGERWTPFLDEVTRLIDLTREVPDETAKAELYRGIVQVSNAGIRLRNDRSGDAYRLLVGALTVNPALVLQVIGRQATGVVDLAKDVATATVQTYGAPESWLRYLRYAAYAAGALIALNVVNALRGR